MKIDSPLCFPLSYEFDCGLVGLLWMHKNNPNLIFSSSSLFVSQTLTMHVKVAALFIWVVCCAAEPPAAQWSNEAYVNRTLRLHKSCVENEQYLHQGLCCLNCNAGKADKRSYTPVSLYLQK